MELDVDLDAGVLAVSAPGASESRCSSAKKDIQGNRKEFGCEYGEAHQGTLPAGDYAIVVTKPDQGGTKEASAPSRPASAPRSTSRERRRLGALGLPARSASV